ncbi:MAG: DUF21 domain-containing protein, partial [Chlamydiales bacterium]|nr:DUF21 domain-containing protein [Chlamydiales bacterium]
MDNWTFYLSLIGICLVVQGAFAMVELACVSFNKVRLQYYVSKNKKRAKWLSSLINHPSYLFGTTLIGVNTALVVGSECSRRFYESLGLSPDFAPITQILIVLIFAEISPMLAGRRYAENAAMLGVPFLMFFSILFRPFIFCLDLLCRLVAKLFQTSMVPGSYLSREELQNVIEEREESLISGPNYKEFNTVVSNIFVLKSKTAKDLMQQLSQTTLLSSSANVSHMQQMVKDKGVSFLPIYHRNLHNIVAVAYPRDFLRVSANTNVFDHARSP